MWSQVRSAVKRPMIADAINRALFAVDERVLRWATKSQANKIVDTAVSMLIEFVTWRVTNPCVVLPRTSVAAGTTKPA